MTRPLSYPRVVTHRPFRRRITVLAVIALVSVGCGPTASTSSTVSTAATTTTAGTTAATTTEPPPPTTTGPEYSVANYGLLPDPLPGSDEAHGSGCVAGGDQLPDGIWFGFVEGVTADTLTFDLACFWTGDAATTRAVADGEEPLDFYIRNEVPTTRTMPFDPSGTAYWQEPAMAPGIESVPMSEWPAGTGYQDCPSDNCAAWVYVNDGVVTQLSEQYLP